MRRLTAAASLLFASALAAQQPSTDSPYKVLSRNRVGGEGGWDYIFADPVGRRLYIPRGRVPAAAATDSTPARAEVPARITVYDLDNPSKLITEIMTAPNSNGNGVAVDAKNGHGFSSSRPQINMFDSKSLQMLKSIPIDSGVGPDGILFDGYNDRVYIFSHPTKDATVIDTKNGTMLGRIALGGVPEQAVADGNGKLYAVMQDVPGSVSVVDVKSMQATAHYSIGDAGRCNGLALDTKNHILFAACGNTGNPPAQPATPTMVILNADNGNIITTLPLAGSSDGAAFNPATMEAFSTGGNGTLTVVKENSPTSFVVEEILQTMNGARTIAFDPKTQHIFTMSQERGPAPPTPPGGGRGRGGFAPAIPGSFTILVIGK